MLSRQLMPLTPEAQGFAELLAESLRGGHRMLSRFEEAWQSSAGRFDRPGEIILGAFEKTRLIGTVGRSIDPYQGDPKVGRIHHLYVAENKRGMGIGRLLVTYMLADAGQHFSEVTVRAPASAFGFYEHLGFKRIVGSETVTHKVLPSNRVGSAFERPLPHHRAYGSVHGGS